MKKNNATINKLTKQIMEVIIMNSGLKWKEDFVKRQLEIAYMEGKIDGIKEIKKRK